MLVSRTATLVLGLTAAAAGAVQGQDTTTAALFGTLAYRYIGPPGNRAIAVVGVPGNPLVAFVGAAAGGIWRTTDGGQRWAKTQLPKARFAVFGEAMAALQFDFLDATHGFAFQSGDVAKGANDSDLFSTSDGGSTWSADRPTGTGSEGIEGTVAFADPGDGVIVDALHGSGIVVTHDGGRTWSDATFPLPSGTRLGHYYFHQPVFFDAQTGLMAVAFENASGVLGVTRIYRTTDAGASWTIAATLPVDYSAVSILSPIRWIAFSLGAGENREIDWVLALFVAGICCKPQQVLLAVR